ncbi:glutamine amidotransferase [Sphingobacterium alimentarium]|uniref:Imidazole glycerol phosphate synthase subunit HisH n=1 Tax=Sphingobacterium alimentarium TaxID=797292 RepID=A0A4V2VU30_9SPHI|nr:imidazole glycerol phosphate synthase subunit HisH [Sphingobacterium alimentarium]TCV10495.1 glutamine amidotransferase [Sphingobacterium alimentarium]
MITIINYGSGNIKAICNIYDQLKVPYKIAKNGDEVVGAEKLFLPGVGAFDETISKLDEYGFREKLDVEVLEKKVPIMGICVGMQVLAESSDEGNLKGLGYVKGHVKKFDESLLNFKPKLPHMGWNSIEITRETPLLKDLDVERGFYFLHSYYFECRDKNDSICTASYGYEFTAAVNFQNVYGVQFHPEKSHSNGVNLLRNFALI